MKPIHKNNGTRTIRNYRCGLDSDANRAGKIIYSLKSMKSKLAILFASTIFAVTTTVPGRAERIGQSIWECRLTFSRQFAGTVTIWWGHTPGDAAWACKNWISKCGNTPGNCIATNLHYVITP